MRLAITEVPRGCSFSQATQRTLDTDFCKQSFLPQYRLDTETKGSTRFRNPRALGCSVPSAARALLRARGFLNRVDPIGLSV